MIRNSKELFDQSRRSLLLPPNNARRKKVLSSESSTGRSLDCSLVMLLRLLVTVSLLQGGLCYFPPLGLFSLYADRVYYVEMLKEVAAICGNDKKALNIGWANNINKFDMKIMETMPAENWYNVEKDATQFNKYDLKSEKTLKELGHVIIDKVEHLAETPEYSKLFHVVVDYGVLGFMTSKRNHESISHYVESYPKLLAPDGILFLKHDMARHDSHHPWVLIRRELVKYFKPYRRVLQITPACANTTLQTKILKADGGDSAVYLKGSHVNDTIVPITTRPRYRNACDAYLHTQWVLK